MPPLTAARLSSLTYDAAADGCQTAELEACQEPDRTGEKCAGHGAGHRVQHAWHRKLNRRHVTQNDADLADGYYNSHAVMYSTSLGGRWSF